jgi:orotate phosphoribosyltransferase
MSEPSAAFLDLVSGRRGHFRLESGHHGALWLNLDTLFVDERRIAPFVTALVEAIRPYTPSAICGPLQGGAFLAQLVARSLRAEFWFTERVMPADRTGDGLYRARYVLPSALSARARASRRIGG